MNVLSKYTFISNYHAEKLTKQQALDEGVGLNEIAKCDTNGDGELTIDEILANQDVCDMLLKAIQAKIDKVGAEESALKAEQAKSEEPGQISKFAA